MDTSAWAAIGAAAFIINMMVLWEVIKGATKTKRHIQLLESQVQLLTSIALKLGVDKESVLSDTKEL